MFPSEDYFCELWDWKEAGKAGENVGFMGMGEGRARKNCRLPISYCRLEDGELLPQMGTDGHGWESCPLRDTGSTKLTAGEGARMNW